MHLAGYPWTSAWILWSIALYVLAGACRLPVVWLQIQMARIAEQAVRDRTELPARFRRYHTIWTALGWPAFLAFVGIFYLMAAKPA